MGKGSKATNGSIVYAKFSETTVIFSKILKSYLPNLYCDSSDIFTKLCEVSGQILIFALHISETKEISRALNREFSSDERSAGAAQDNMDMFCAPLHGDMTTCARRSTLDSFRTGRIRVLVCTDVASRGLDVELGKSVFSSYI